MLARARRYVRGPAFREAVLVFGLYAIYYGVVSPYAIVRRVVFRRPLLSSKSGWRPKRQSTADPSIYTHPY